jgi:cell division protein ZipA
MELRWVLLGLGLLVILGILLFGQGIARRSGGSATMRRAQRREPSLDAAATVSEEFIDEAQSRSLEKIESPAIVERKPSPRRAPEKVVALRIVPKGELPNGETTVLALRKLGLEHGQFGIFHKNAGTQPGDPLFSVARLTEPGTFDLTKLAETEVPGLSIFLTLPGSGDPVERFDQMMETARALARELESEILDEKGSSWSIQRERYLREEMIQYRHHHGRDL